MTPAPDAPALALSASGAVAQAALRLSDGSVRSAPTRVAEPSRDVAPLAAIVVAQAGLTPRDLRAALVDVGPGSYTGLRVAVTFARMLAWSAGLPLFVLTSFELLAVAARDAGLWPEGEDLWVALDARRDAVHLARLRGGTHIEVVGTPRAVRWHEAPQALAPDAAIVADTSILERIRTLAPRATSAAPFQAEQLFAAALRPRLVEPAAVEPLYLMGSYAE
ncbi:MAG: tRNA (adenosine(37)-N6)-threonylcarbamoyltransferase complex dimerization subunit type 1 TsaB [Planctomycetes bacterium]|nr:tRNA (adenosine(37)-N6)-threonylcarbamoyltransferase complex dimerization subunit type 1 TsaB [Planctomycetota bacterium]